MRKKVHIEYGGIKYPKEGPKGIAWKDLLGPGHFPRRGFPGKDTKDIVAHDGQITWPNRYAWHNTFFRDRGKQIESLADIGPGLSSGAPTTLEARQLLPHAKVIAVDHKGDFSNPDLVRERVGIIKHSIVEEPLPFEVQAVRFANVSFLLSGSGRRAALLNIHKSLPEGGLLLGNDHIYRKRGRGFEIIASRGD